MGRKKVQLFLNTRVLKFCLTDLLENFSSQENSRSVFKNHTQTPPLLLHTEMKGGLEQVPALT